MVGTISKRKAYAAGEDLAREGEADNSWFILLTGQVGVYKGGLRVDTFDDPGTVFGEISCILSVPRTATLRALTDSVVLALDTDIDDLIAHHPDIAKKILVALAERLAKTTDILLWTIKESEEGRRADR